MDGLTLLNIGISLITIAFVASQTYLLQKQISAEYEWRRREKSLSYSQIYNPEVAQVRKRLDHALGYIQNKAQAMTEQEIRDAFTKDQSLRVDINFLLSYYENVALSVRHGVASFDVIYDLMGNTYLKYWYLFRAYIDMDRSDNPRLWQNMEMMVGLVEEKRKTQGEKPVTLPKFV
jgi:hypothetical protein